MFTSSLEVGPPAPVAGLGCGVGGVGSGAVVGGLTDERLGPHVGDGLQPNAVAAAGVAGAELRVEHVGLLDDDGGGLLLDLTTAEVAVPSVATFLAELPLTYDLVAGCRATLASVRHVSPPRGRI